MTKPIICSLIFHMFFLFFAIFFSKSTFLNYFRNATKVPFLNSLDPDQARHSVGPDLGANCLQKLSADDTSRQRVKLTSVSFTILSVQTIGQFSYVDLFIFFRYIKPVQCVS